MSADLFDITRPGLPRSQSREDLQRLLDDQRALINDTMQRAGAAYERGTVEGYRDGWRWGMVCGLLLGMLLGAVLAIGGMAAGWISA